MLYLSSQNRIAKENELVQFTTKSIQKFLIIMANTCPPRNGNSGETWENLRTKWTGQEISFFLTPDKWVYLIIWDSANYLRAPPANYFLNNDDEATPFY
jgi:hypothetical protein